MGFLQDRIREDMQDNLKHGDRSALDSRKVIVGELQRQPKKDLSFEEEVKILKKLEKAEEDRLEILGEDEETEYLKIIRKYLPTLASVEEIKGWILKTVNFPKLKNPMQAVGITMKAFGPRADGKTVKQIVIDIVNEGGKAKE